MTTKRFTVLGAGRQAAAAVDFLLECFADTEIDLVDKSRQRLSAARSLMRHPTRVRCHERALDSLDSSVTQLIRESDCVISGLPYYLNLPVARATIELGRPFCDFGCNVATMEAELELDPLCRAAGVPLVTDCGLGPGLLSSLAEYWAQEWEYSSVRLYCGGLPQNVRGVLKYSLTFNVCGLLNEYFDRCEVSRGGEVEYLDGLSEVEVLDDLPLPGRFEAFSTSGGASLGPRLYAPRGVDYQYKTIRYPGHRDIFQGLAEMGLLDPEPREVVVNGDGVKAAPRDLVAAILEDTLASPDGRDCTVGRAEVVGRCEGRRKRGRVDFLDYADDRFTSMARLTGFPAGVVAAGLAGLYEFRVEPRATVQFQAVPSRTLVGELRRAGVEGITISEREVPHLS